MYTTNYPLLITHIMNEAKMYYKLLNKIENRDYVKSTNENIIRFRDYLNKNGIVATIRRELGSDIDAACGQLRRKSLKEE